MAITFEKAAGPSQCFLVGSLLVLVGVALPVVRTKLGKSAGFDGAPTLVELYNEGKGYQGTRIDISYDILLVGALFILLGGAQCHYPEGYLWTIKLGVLLWPVVALLGITYKIMALRQRRSARAARTIFEKLFSMGQWRIDRRSRKWTRSRDYQVTANSVYSDPNVPWSSILFKVLVPQVIGMILYLVFIFRPWKFTAKQRRFGVYGIFFTPVFIKVCEFTTDSIPGIQLMLFLRFIGSNPGLVDEKRGIVVVSEQGGETHRYSSEELNYFAGGAYARRIFVYTLINYSAACVLTLSLPIFLAQSDNPIEFILNAVASTFIIQLDDAPTETLTYTISDAACADVEEELPAARVSELSTGAATGQK